MVHNIDPVIASVFGVHLWWYGLSYTLGFLNAHLWLRRHRDRIRLGRHIHLLVSGMYCVGKLLVYPMSLLQQGVQCALQHLCVVPVLPGDE